MNENEKKRVNVNYFLFIFYIMLGNLKPGFDSKKV
jgi:hypothetical protein